MRGFDKKYKHIFVDFDSTLFLWDGSVLDETDPIEWEADGLTGSRNYNADQLNLLLIEYLQNSGAEITLLTHSEISTDAEAKFQFIDDHYPGLLNNYICSSSAGTKVLVLKAFEESGTPKSDMLIIDNSPVVIDTCQAEGFDTQEPQYIMHFMFVEKHS